MSAKPSALPKPQAGQPCPCGSGLPYDACCGPLHAGQRKAANAELLMRSRFAAHVAGDFRYLHHTHQPTAKLPYVEDPEESTVGWSRLVVHSHEPGKNPDHAFVDFSAYFVEEGAEHALHEKSEFHRINGEWLYTRPVRQGPAPIKSAQAKVGRNDPCPCGSGKKYKHCCLKA